jgi:hypothetical protein
MGNLTITNLWTHDPECHKLVLDPKNYKVIASVQCESPVQFHVGFEEDPSEQVGKHFSFMEYSEVRYFVLKVLPILEVAKRVDDELKDLLKSVYGIKYSGGFVHVVDAFLDDIEDHFYDAEANNNSILDSITYLTFEYLENAWDHQENLGVFLEDERCVDAFLETQYQKNKEFITSL